MGEEVTGEGPGCGEGWKSGRRRPWGTGYGEGLTAEGPEYGGKGAGGGHSVLT